MAYRLKLFPQKKKIKGGEGGDNQRIHLMMSLLYHGNGKNKEISLCSAAYN